MLGFEEKPAQRETYSLIVLGFGVSGFGMSVSLLSKSFLPTEKAPHTSLAVASSFTATHIKHFKLF